MKKIYSILLFLSVLLPAQSLTPPRSYEVTATNGLVVNVTENGRFTTYATTDGRALLPGTNGLFYYATLNKAGEIVPSDLHASNIEARSLNERAWLNKGDGLSEKAITTLLERLLPRPTLFPTLPEGRSAASTNDGLGKLGQSGLGAVKSIGSPRIPVIMAAFSDVDFAQTTTTEKISRFLNEPGYADERYAVGSVRDYFISQSGGLFSPDFDVVARVMVDGTRATYGKDGENGAIDPNGTQFVREAVAAAAKTVDFSSYATDGAVPFVAVIFPGPGQQSAFEDGRSEYLWAKFSGNHTIATTEGGPIVKSFIVANELLQSYGSGPNDITSSTLDGVGLFAHEFGHALGLPDMYYTGKDASVSSSLLTMDYWDIMDYGQYFMNGYAPPGYTAYERANLGWLQPEELTEAAFLHLSGFEADDENHKAYVLRNPNNEKEYFLFENRTVGTWYPKAMGEGMLVTHIDYDAVSWAANTVNNNPDRQRVSYIPADGIKDGTSTKNMTLQQLLDGYKGDLYPGTTGNNEFSTATEGAKWQTPDSPTYDHPLYNIARGADGVVTFSFLDPTLTAISLPTDSSPASTDRTIYTLSGRRLVSIKQAAPGIYITANGRKIVKTGH